MSESILKCKNCGNSIDLRKAIDGVVECEYCGSFFTVPKKELSSKALSFLSQGELDLDVCRFDEAYTAYSKAAEYDSNEPEAYWGMALAEFRVQYLKDKIVEKDKITGEKKIVDHLQPICHGFIEKDFLLNKNYLHALELATDKQKIEYEKKAKEIDDIRNKFIELKDSGLNFDTFICVKVSKLDDEQSDSSKKNWTQDAYYADSIYDLLKREGYSPFFSEREVRGRRTGADYEALILYALYTSETMLVVCSNEEYLNTPWVKNEYTRFKELVNNKDKENDSLTIVYNETPIERLPGIIGRIQGIDYSRREADFEIAKFVKEHTPLSRAKREKERRKKEEEVELFRKQIEEQKKIQQDFEERLNSLNTRSVTGAVSTIEKLLTRANQEMEVKNFSKADKFFETVLEKSPENSAAWWGKFLCDFKVVSENSIIRNLDNQILKSIVSNQNYGNAKKYASGQMIKLLNSFKEQIKQKLGAKIENITNEIGNIDSQILCEENTIDQIRKEHGKNIQEEKKLVSETEEKIQKFRQSIYWNYKLPSINLEKLIIISIVGMIAYFIIMIVLGYVFGIWKMKPESVNKAKLEGTGLNYIFGWGFTLGFFGVLLQSVLYGNIPSLLVGIVCLPCVIIKTIGKKKHVKLLSELDSRQKVLNKNEKKLNKYLSAPIDKIEKLNDNMTILKKDIDFKEECIKKL